jgi:hypothetical protein
MLLLLLSASCNEREPFAIHDIETGHIAASARPLGVPGLLPPAY